MIARRPTWYSRGDVDKAFAEADLVYEGDTGLRYCNMRRPESRVAVANGSPES